ERARARYRRARRDDDVRRARPGRRADRVGKRGAARARRIGWKGLRDRRAVGQHPRRAAGQRRRQGRRQARHAQGRRGVPQISLLARGPGNRREGRLSPARRERSREIREPVPATFDVHGRRGVRRLAEGAGDAFRRRRHVRPDLRAGAMTLRRRRHALPGFGLTLGLSLAYLALIVLIPLAALALKSATIGPLAFWTAV